MVSENNSKNSILWAKESFIIWNDQFELFIPEKLMILVKNDAQMALWNSINRFYAGIFLNINLLNKNVLF